MKSIELLAVAIKVLGIYLAIMGLKTIALQFQLFTQYSMASNYGDIKAVVFVGLIQIAFMFLAAFFMFKFPVAVSKWFLPKTKEGEVELSGDFQDIQTILFCVIGVYILSWAIPDFLNNAIWIWYVLSEPAYDTSNLHQFLINQIVTSLEIIIGLYLAVKSEGVSKLINHLRRVGTG